MIDNNDRYLYLNVDDSPAPIPELRRLLDMNLAYLWQPRITRLRTEGKDKEAREAAAKVARYQPTGNSYLTLGILDYSLGEKTAALTDFRKALELDPAVRQRFQVSPDGAGGRGGQGLRTILEDKNFLKQLFPEQ